MARPLLRLGAPVLAAGGLLSGCEAQRVGALIPDRDAAPAPDAAGLSLDGGGGDGVLHPDGTWLLFMQDRYCLYAAGIVSDFLVWSWYRVSMSAAGPGAQSSQTYFQQKVKLCAQDQSPVTAGLVTYVPATVTGALPERTLDGYLLGSRMGGQYLSEELAENWGLSDAVGPDDPLPETAQDPRVIDQDGDDLPGVTLIIGDNFCTVQIVQRTRYRPTGTVVAGHRIEGTLWSDVAKSVLGASLPLCGTSNTLEARPEGNRMVLVRVDDRSGGSDLDADGDGDVDCAEITAARERLLGADIVVKDEPNAARCR